MKKFNILRYAIENNVQGEEFIEELVLTLSSTLMCSGRTKLVRIYDEGLPSESRILVELTTK